MSKITITNENDQVIGAKERSDVQQEDIYRVSALWITNSKGDILLAQRSFDKSHDPGKWGPAVAGTVEEEETYEQNIYRETQEELGLRDVKLNKSIKKRITGIHNYFSQWFMLEIDKDVLEFEIQKNEVEQIKWFTKEELLAQIKINPEKFLRSMPGHVDEFVK